MNENTRIKREYYDWMLSKIDPKKRNFSNHTRLLELLHRRDFRYSLAMDENRYADGIDLRYRFGYELGIDRHIISTELDDGPCSVLEMMVALAMRCEERIMGNDTIGDRTSLWIITMLNNLNLLVMTDMVFDTVSHAEEDVNHIIDIFLNREYEPNGNGGLIVLDNCQYDLRNVDIWYQMMWYLNEHYC